MLVKADELVSGCPYASASCSRSSAGTVPEQCRSLSGTDVVNELLLQNRAYRQFAGSVSALYPHSAELRAAKEEVEQLYVIWDSVRDARCDYYYVHIRRQALKRLHDILGEKDYNEGQLPPHVPLWRFAAVR